MSTNGEGATGSTTRHDIWLILVGSVIAAAAGLGGAYLGSRGPIDAQRTQARESRLAEARTKRASVYSVFLNAAETYRFETEAATDAIKRSVARAGSVKAACKQARAGPACGVRSALFDRQDNARSNFQGALNQVYVYGSPRGVRAARKVAAGLPPSIYDPARRIALGDIDTGAFSSGYNAVLDTMCAEVSADPRPKC